MIENDTFGGSSGVSPVIPRAAHPTSSLPSFEVYGVESQSKCIEERLL